MRAVESAASKPRAPWLGRRALAQAARGRLPSSDVDVPAERGGMTLFHGVR
jgi:hypothetical protein